MSKSEKNKIKSRLTFSQAIAIWTCTDGVSYNDCNEAIAHEQEIMKEEVDTNAE